MKKDRSDRRRRWLASPTNTQRPSTIDTSRCGSGNDYLHAAVDDRSRLAYAKILADETGQTCAALLVPRRGIFPAHGTTIGEVINDNALT